MRAGRLSRSSCCFWCPPDRGARPATPVPCSTSSSRQAVAPASCTGSSRPPRRPGGCAATSSRSTSPRPGSGPSAHLQVVAAGSGSLGGDAQRGRQIKGFSARRLAPLGHPDRCTTSVGSVAADAARAGAPRRAPRRVRLRLAVSPGRPAPPTRVHPRRSGRCAQPRRPGSAAGTVGRPPRRGRPGLDAVRRGRRPRRAVRRGPCRGPCSDAVVTAAARPGGVLPGKTARRTAARCGSGRPDRLSSHRTSADREHPVRRTDSLPPGRVGALPRRSCRAVRRCGATSAKPSSTAGTWPSRQGNGPRPIPVRPRRCWAQMQRVLPAEPRGGPIPFAAPVSPRPGAGPTERLANWCGHARPSA